MRVVAAAERRLFPAERRLFPLPTLPLTQNTLLSKDVREYVFFMFFDDWRSRDLPGVILNEFGLIWTQ